MRETLKKNKQLIIVLISVLAVYLIFRIVINIWVERKITIIEEQLNEKYGIEFEESGFVSEAAEEVLLYEYHGRIEDFSYAMFVDTGAERKSIVILNDKLEYVADTYAYYHYHEAVDNHTREILDQYLECYYLDEGLKTALNFTCPIKKEHSEDLSQLMESLPIYTYLNNDVEYGLVIEESVSEEELSILYQALKESKYPIGIRIYKTNREKIEAYKESKEPYSSDLREESEQFYHPSCWYEWNEEE